MKKTINKDAQRGSRYTEQERGPLGRFGPKKAPTAPASESAIAAPPASSSPAAQTFTSTTDVAAPTTPTPVAPTPATQQQVNYIQQANAIASNADRIISWIGQNIPADNPRVQSVVQTATYNLSDAANKIRQYTAQKEGINYDGLASQLENMAQSANKAMMSVYSGENAPQTGQTPDKPGVETTPRSELPEVLRKNLPADFQAGQSMALSGNLMEDIQRLSDPGFRSYVETVLNALKTQGVQK